MVDRVTIGVLGGNSWIANVAVLPAIAVSRNATLGTVGTRNGPVRYDDVLADPANDAVYIPLPNGLHRHWVERVAARGKHVLCEKPLAPTAADAAAMFRACELAGVHLAEAYMTPFHPRSREVRQRIRSGDLGELRHADAAFTFPLAPASAETNYRWLPEQGGGALLDVGIYCLAPLLDAFGLPSQASAQSVRTDRGIDLTTSASLRWPDCGTASVLVSFELAERQSLQICGTEGTMSIDRAFTPGPDDKTFTVQRLDGRTEEFSTDGGNCYVGMIEAFADSVLGRAAWERTPAEVLAVLSLCEDLATPPTVVA